MPDVAVNVLEEYACARPGSSLGAGLRPLDEYDRVLEVWLEIAPVGIREAGEAIEVEMETATRPP